LKFAYVSNYFQIIAAFFYPANGVKKAGLG